MSVSSVSPEHRMVFTKSHCAGLSEAAQHSLFHLSIKNDMYSYTYGMRDAHGSKSMQTERS